MTKAASAANKKTAPAIRIALKGYKLHINRAVMSVLGNPPYLHILYSEKRLMLALSGNDEESANTFEVPKRAAYDECCISRIALTEALRLRMGWDANRSYRITGEFLPDMGVVLFDLTSAAVVSASDTNQSEPNENEGAE